MNNKGPGIDFRNIKYDLPAGIAVFFVAIPLCLGIAHASGAPLIAGLISGVVGGLVIGSISGSQLAVSGPAAGLTAIAIAGIERLGSYQGLLMATVLAGIIQLFLGLFKAGRVAKYIPAAVIKGMLSAIGVILIIKQLPHMIGYDIEEMGVEEFELTKQDVIEGQENIVRNTFSVLAESISNLNDGVLIIGLVSLVFLFLWDKTLGKKLKTVPGSLVVVLLGVAISLVYEKVLFLTHLSSEHYVNVPAVSSISAFINATTFPDWSLLSNAKLYLTGVTIAIVASIETLLSIEAIDKLDPFERKADPNRELLAQGTGNTLAGLIGGLPMTAVIVRGSVNVSAGARSKLSTIIHGTLIVIAVLFLASYINLIPLASLAAVLVYTGYKLVKPETIIELYKKGWEQFLPYIITVVAIVFTDLLIGVLIGCAVAMIWIVKRKLNRTGTLEPVEESGNEKKH
jgi:MFS superfamily sulfate permease-like transporter